MGRTSTNQLSDNGTLVNGYDYNNQAWVRDGVYQDCNHPEAGARINDPFLGKIITFDGCSCYGRAHAGESCIIPGDGSELTATVDLSEFRKTGDYDHKIGVATRTFVELPHVVQAAIYKAFMTAPRGDHFYSITCGVTKVFVCENGERGYTAMLPEEY